MKLSLALLFLGMLAGCHKTLTSASEYRLNILADRSCRAVSIRKERFVLADKIRFAQDTLARTKSKADSARLQASLVLYLKQKDILLKASIRLADTIHRQLDSLVPYNNKAAEKRFTARLKGLLAKKGCQDIDQ